MRRLFCRNVVIGFVDSGVSPHAEFTSDQLVQRTFAPTGKPIADALDDKSGHGTFVAALAAGATKGWAPGARVVSASVFHHGEAKLQAVLPAIQWLVTTKFNTSDGPRGVDVLVVSAGTRTFNRDYYAALRAAYDRGVTLVAAIGNRGLNGGQFTESPANYDFVIGVGSSFLDGNVERFFAAGTARGIVNNRQKPDVCTLGLRVESAVKGGYSRQTGTSYACASIAGACARLIHKFPAIRRKPHLVKRLLQQRCAKGAGWAVSEWGYLDRSRL